MVSNQAGSPVQEARSPDNSDRASHQTADAQEETAQEQIPSPPNPTPSAPAFISHLYKTWSYTLFIKTLLLAQASALAASCRRCQFPINSTGAVVAIVTSPLVVLGTWAALEALRISQWTKRKDELAWCEDHDWNYPGCEALKDEPLSLPRALSASREGEQESAMKFRPFLAAQHWLAALKIGYLRFLCIVGLSITCLQIVIIWTNRDRIVQLVRHALKWPTAEPEKKHRARVIRTEHAAKGTPENAKAIVHEDGSNNPEGASVPFNLADTTESDEKTSTRSLPKGEKGEATTQPMRLAPDYLYNPPSTQDHTRPYVEPYLRVKSKKKRSALALGRATVFTSGGATGQRLRWICPNCPGSNNSWEYDTSCPFCFKSRPSHPKTLYD